MKVLFVIYSKVHLRTLSPYIEKLAKDNSNEVTLYLGKAELLEDELYLSKWGKVIRSHLCNRAPDSAANALRGKIGKEKLRTNWLQKLKSSAIEFLRVTKELIKRKKQASEFLIQTSPDAIFLSAERYLDLDLPIAQAAKQLQIPCFVGGIDYFYVESFQGFAISRTPLNWKTDPLAMIVAMLFPSQTFAANGERYLFYGPGGVMSLAVTGMLFPTPFLGGTHPSVVKVFVDTEETKREYLKYNVPENKIMVTGLSETKDLVDSYRNKMESRFYVSSKLNIIFSLPQLFEHFVISQDQQRDFIKYVLSLICSEETNVTLSLHPKQNREAYEYLEREFPVKILDRPLKNCLGIADLYICTYSSTVLFSLFLKVPTFIIDFFDLNYTSFKNNKSLQIYDQKADFEKAFAEWKSRSSSLLSTSPHLFRDSQKFSDDDGCEIALTAIQEHVN